jgi:hypothetical protein
MLDVGHMVLVLYVPGPLAAAARAGMYAMPSSSAAQAAPTAALRTDTLWTRWLSTALLHDSRCVFACQGVTPFEIP